MSYFDVLSQSTRSKVLSAVETLLPDALVNSSDVFAQIAR